VNVSLTETFFKNITFYLYKGGILNDAVTYTDDTRFHNFTACVCDDWQINATTCTTTNQCNTTETRYYTIDTVEPVITIAAPDSLYTYLYENKTLFFNFTATDDHLDKCIWNYNGTNYSAACSTGVEFKTVIGQELNDFNITIYANDSFGNENSVTKTWGYQFFETDREYSATTLQTSIEDFILSLLKNSTLSAYSASLIYNNSIYASTTSASGSALNFSNTIDIPLNSANSSFLWNISFTNTTGTFGFNTTTSYQVANNLTISRCYTAYPDSYVLNFTTYDSTNLTALNSTFEMNFYFYSSTGSGAATGEFLFTDTNENVSNYMFCVNSSSNNVTANAVVSYGATSYDSRQYIIDDGTIYQSIQNISLYLTETALTDIVTVQVQDQGYSPIAGAVVYIQKWNVGTNTYSTVGMFTTSEIGEGIMDLELYTTFYRAVVYYEGTIITTTETQKLSSATWTITIDLAIDSPYDLFGDIIGAVTFDNTTNITSFTWLDSSGYTQRGCLIVKQYTNLGLSTLSSSCTSSVSGTIDYQLLNNGSYIAYGQIYIAEFGIFENIDTLEIYLGTSNLVRTISPFGKVISALVIGTMGMIGVAAGSAILGSILLIAGLFLLSWIGFLNISSGFIWGMITIAVIIIALQRRRK